MAIIVPTPLYPRCFAPWTDAEDTCLLDALERHPDATLTAAVQAIHRSSHNPQGPLGRTVPALLQRARTLVSVDEFQQRQRCRSRSWPRHPWTAEDHALLQAASIRFALLSSRMAAERLQHCPEYATLCQRHHPKMLANRLAGLRRQTQQLGPEELPGSSCRRLQAHRLARSLKWSAHEVQLLREGSARFSERSARSAVAEMQTQPEYAALFQRRGAKNVSNRLARWRAARLRHEKLCP